MAKLEGLNKVLSAIMKRVDKYTGDVSVAVGYTAYYALYVHENLDPVTMGMSIPRPSGLGVYWGPNGQPKFLEEPFRNNKDVYAGIVRRALLDGQSLKMALLLAGLQLQRDSMELVPVEYGNLRASAFTRVEEPAVE